MRKNNNASGWMMIELIMVMGILGVLAVTITVSMNSFAKLNKMYLVNQQCISACRAQLDSISATGKPISKEDCKRLWPGIETVISRCNGAGKWEGLELVQVTATAESRPGKAGLQQSRYVNVRRGQ